MHEDYLRWHVNREDGEHGYPSTSESRQGPEEGAESEVVENHKHQEGQRPPPCGHYYRLASQRAVAVEGRR
uniref:Uncharacterized protein n=1 Tax=uncultured bacterium A1Q1_fos_862 TaxID=1256590 RepID=L7VZM1_9BACT|nr:hypothetical protein [uncultured bacterium A1Q1_fos_862]